MKKVLSKTLNVQHIPNCEIICCVYYLHQAKQDIPDAITARYLRPKSDNVNCCSPGALSSVSFHL